MIDDCRHAIEFRMNFLYLLTDRKSPRFNFIGCNNAVEIFRYYNEKAGTLTIEKRKEKKSGKIRTILRECRSRERNFPTTKKKWNSEQFDMRAGVGKREENLWKKFPCFSEKSTMENISRIILFTLLKTWRKNIKSPLN